VTTPLFGLHFEFTTVIQTNIPTAFYPAKKFSMIIINGMIYSKNKKMNLKIRTYVEQTLQHTYTGRFYQ